MEFILFILYLLIASVVFGYAVGFCFDKLFNKKTAKNFVPCLEIHNVILYKK